jgi:hypothetical protein
MSDVAWTGYLASVAAGFGFFFFVKRRFDFLTLAFIGALFYFFPLVFGRVLQSSPDLTSSIQPVVYFIATGYALSLVAAAVVADRFTPSIREPAKSASMSGVLLLLAICGLVVALVESKGDVIQFDKVKGMQQIGIFYVLFETAASLGCIAAAVERRWWFVAAGALLLTIDLLTGFRAYTTLTALGVGTALLGRQCRFRLYRKAPSYGAALIVLALAMLLTHSARFAIFDQIAAWRGVPTSERMKRASDMRSDTIQYQRATTSKQIEGSDAVSAVEPPMPKWGSIPFHLLEQSEPFMIQATLVGVVQTGLSCTASNILKAAWVLIPPGLTKLVPNPYPPTFYDEYQPILYPDITYGTGGNIWAEMLCRFGYPGLLVFDTLLILALIGLSRLLLIAPPILTAPISLAGVILAFYIHRNDLNYTLVMLKQIVWVFLAAYLLTRVAAWLPQAARSGTQRSQ